MRTTSTWASSGRRRDARPWPAGTGAPAHRVVVPSLARVVFFRRAGQSLVVQRSGHALSQFFEGQRCRPRSSAHQVGPRPEVGVLLRHHSSQPSPQAIAPDGTTHSSADGIRHSDVIREGFSGVGYRDRTPSHPPPRPTQGGEGGPVADRLDQGVSMRVGSTRRPIRRKACGGLFGDATAGSPVPPGSTSDAGSRASSPAGGSSVGMFASPMTPTCVGRPPSRVGAHDAADNSARPRWSTAFRR